MEVKGKRLAGVGAVSIFMRTDFLFNFSLSVTSGPSSKRHPTPNLKSTALDPFSTCATQI